VSKEQRYCLENKTYNIGEEVFHQSSFGGVTKNSQGIPVRRVIRRRIKVFKWPLPCWVRPKRAAKRCDWHAKQDTVRYKNI